jgi:hypothetical protein
MNTGGMDLAERSECEALHAKLLEEEVPIFPHPGARLAPIEFEAQPRRRATAHSTPAGTERMNQPGITADKRMLDPS